MVSCQSTYASMLWLRLTSRLAEVVHDAETSNTPNRKHNYTNVPGLRLDL